MTDRMIRLVRNDTRPPLELELFDEATQEQVNLTGATVRLKFRAVDSTALVATVTGEIVSPTEGSVRFDWTTAPEALASAAGDYEGEVEVTFDDESVQTVYTVLKFRLREDF